MEKSINENYGSEHMERFNAFFEFASAIASIVDIDALLKKMCIVTAELLDAKGCVIRLKEKNQLSVKASHGISNGVLNVIRQRVGQEIPFHVSKTGESILIQDTSSLSRNLKIFRLMIKSIICVPLKKGDKVIGTLEVYDKKEGKKESVSSFIKDDLLTIEGFALIVSLAIDNANVYKKEKEQEQKALNANKRLETLFNSVRSAIITLDRDYNIIFANKTIKNWIDRESKQILRKNCHDIFDSANGILPHEAAKVTFETGQIYSMTGSRNNNIAEITAYPIKGAGGINECIVVIRDITDRIRHHIETERLLEKVKIAENELNNIFDSISDLVFTADNNFEIKKANKAVFELLGKPEKEIIGKKCYKVFNGINSTNKICSHTKDSQNKRVSISEIENFFHKNSDTYVLSNSPLLDPAGNVTGTVHIAKNISEIKKLREQLAKTERVAALGEMAAGVAHAIRNPLVSIGGFTKRLEKKLDPPLKEYAKIISDEVNRLEVILTEILGFVREKKMSRDTIDISALLHSSVHIMQQSLHKSIIIEEDLSKENLEISGDPSRLMDAFFNLLKNAEQSIDKSGTIRVKTSKSNGRAIIEIEDSGKGMDEDIKKHIYNPFYTTKTSGTGLGLAITQKALEEHKGTIEVDSKAGVGTRFKISLPLKG